MNIYKTDSDIERAVRLAGQTIINRAAEIAGSAKDMSSIDISINLEQDSTISISWNKYIQVLPPHLLDNTGEVTHWGSNT